MAKLEAAAVIVVGGIVAFLLWKMHGIADIAGGVSTFASEKYTELEKSTEKYFDTLIEKREIMIERVEKGEISGQPVTVQLPYMAPKKVETTSIPSFQFFTKKIDHDFIKLGGWLPIPTKFSLYSREFDMPFVSAFAPPGATVRAPIVAPTIMSAWAGSSSGSGSRTTWQPVGQDIKKYPVKREYLNETVKNPFEKFHRPV